MFASIFPAELAGLANGYTSLSLLISYKNASRRPLKCSALQETQPEVDLLSLVKESIVMLWLTLEKESRRERRAGAAARR